MNVLFIAHYHVIDGSARSLLSLAQGLVRFSVKPYFVVPKRGGLTELLDGLQMPYSEGTTGTA